MPARRGPAPADAISARCHHACDDAKRRPSRLKLRLVVLLLARGADGAVAPQEVWTAVATGHRVIDPPQAVDPRRILGVADPTMIIGDSCGLCWPMIACMPCVGPFRHPYHARSAASCLLCVPSFSTILSSSSCELAGGR